MKIKITAVFVFAVLLTLISCNSNEAETVKVSGRYTIDIPTSLSKADNLNEGASLQYSNERKELYIIVMEEPKKVYEDIIASDPESYQPGLEGYAGLLLESTESKIKTDASPALAKRKVGNLDAYTTEFSGVVDGLHIYWKMAYIEGKNRYYQIMAWTLNDKKEVHGPTMDAMINSFKETDKTKRH